METKVCRQCGRELPIDEFLPYKSRSTGLYNTTVGRHTMCKTCEALSRYADNIVKKESSGAALCPEEEEDKRLLLDAIHKLEEMGRPIMLAGLRRLAGMDPLQRRGKSNSALRASLKTLHDTLSESAASDTKHRQALTTKDSIADQMRLDEHNGLVASFDLSCYSDAVKDFVNSCPYRSVDELEAAYELIEEELWAKSSDFARALTELHEIY